MYLLFNIPITPLALIFSCESVPQGGYFSMFLQLSSTGDCYYLFPCACYPGVGRFGVVLCWPDSASVLHSACVPGSQESDFLSAFGLGLWPQWWGLSYCLDTRCFPAHAQEWRFYLLPSCSPQLQWFSTTILRIIEFAAFPRMP